MGIRHRRVCISCHPRTIVLSLWSISTPSLVNITLHLASHSSATATRLCNIFGMRYPRVAACRSDDNASCSVLVVVMWLPLGMVTCLLGSCCSATFAGALLCNNVSDAALSINAVSSSLYILAQLGILLGSNDVLILFCTK